MRNQALESERGGCDLSPTWRTILHAAGYGEGEERAFVHRMASAVQAKCGQASMLPQDSEDVVQEVVVRVATKWRDDASMPDDERRKVFWAFVRTLVAHVVHEQLRKQIRQRRKFPHSLDPEDHRAMSPERSDGDACDMAEAAGLLEKWTLDPSISPMDRDVITLRFWGGLSYREIAEHFAVPIGTMSSWLSKAVTSLRKVVARDNPEFLDIIPED